MPETRLSELLKEKERINREIDAIRAKNEKVYREKIKEERKEIVGKFFLNTGCTNYHYSNIKVLKVLSINEKDPSCFKCAVVANNCIRLQDVYLFHTDAQRLMDRENNLIVMDYFKEISEYEFLETFDYIYEHIRRTI